MQEMLQTVESLPSHEAQDFQARVMANDKGSAIPILTRHGVSRDDADLFYTQARDYFLGQNLMLEELTLEEAPEHMQAAWQEAERQRAKAPYYLVRYGLEIAQVRVHRRIYRNQPIFEFYFSGMRRLTLADIHQVWALKHKIST